MPSLDLECPVCAATIEVELTWEPADYVRGRYEPGHYIAEAVEGCEENGCNLTEAELVAMQEQADERAARYIDDDYDEQEA